MADAPSRSAAQDTIAALATPRGTGAVAVIRISGPYAFDIAARHCHPALEASSLPDRRALVRHFVDADGALIDRTVFLFMRGPRSFTGEDVAEVHSHGGLLVARRIMETLAASGARTAGPGEFTLRAFLNGKMTLEEAEGVDDLIRAETDRALGAAAGLMEGRLGERVREAMQRCITQKALIEAAIDFSDEEVPPYDPQTLAQELAGLAGELRQLASTYQRGRLVREGIRVALAGAPNTGKSTLMNALLERSRMIVSDIPGTTRDAVEEALELDGWKIVLVDTAGLREETGDPVEAMGMEISRSEIERADILLALLDSTRATTEAEKAAVARWQSEGRNILVVVNKSDAASPQFDPPASKECISISAKTGAGVEELKQALLNRLEQLAGPSAPDAVVITRLRHQQALDDAAEALERAGQSITENATPDCVAVDLEAALEALGRILGRISSDDILGEIFSRFCIGK